jgi:hypothetical protein
MGLDSDQLGLSDPLDARQPHAGAAPVIEPPRGQRVRRGDDAQQALAQRVAPRAHGADVATARREPAHRVRVHEPDDVAAVLLPSQRPRTVGGDRVGPAAPVAQTPTPPRAGAANAD